MGYGLVTEIRDEKWKHERALFNPGFHKLALKSFMKEFNAKADILMDHLRTIAEQKPAEKISLFEKFNRTTLDVIASIAFSMNIDSINDPKNQLNRYIFEALDGIIKFFNDPLMRLKPHKWSYIKNYRNSVRYLRDIGRKQIESRIEAFKKGENLPEDILSTILRSHENEEFGIEQMVDQFITFFIGGQETTSNTLASAFLELGRNPHVLEKLRKEIDDNIGLKHEIEFDDLSKLQYTGAVIKEALRLYPPIPDLFRITKEEIETDEFKIPKGTPIGLSIYSCGRCGDYFDEPYQFQPERFLKENHESIQNYTYFPFSLGVRNCIGQNFAQIEAKVLIAKFIQNFDFKLDPNQSFAIYQAATLRPKDGTKCFIYLKK